MATPEPSPPPLSTQLAWNLVESWGNLKVPDHILTELSSELRTLVDHGRGT